MIVITLLLIVLAAELGVLLWRLEHYHQPTAPFPSEASPAPVQMSPHFQVVQAPPLGEVELLRRGADGGWCHHSWRAATSPDITEALDTPGMAIRTAAGVQEGRQ